MFQLRKKLLPSHNENEAEFEQHLPIQLPLSFSHSFDTVYLAICFPFEPFFVSESILCPKKILSERKHHENLGNQKPYLDKKRFIAIDFVRTKKKTDLTNNKNNLCAGVSDGAYHFLRASRWSEKLPECTFNASNLTLEMNESFTFRMKSA